MNADLLDKENDLKYNVIILSHGLSAHMHSYTSYAK